MEWVSLILAVGGALFALVIVGMGVGIVIARFYRKVDQGHALIVVGSAPPAWGHRVTFKGSGSGAGCSRRWADGRG